MSVDAIHRCARCGYLARRHPSPDCEWWQGEPDGVMTPDREALARLVCNTDGEYHPVQIDFDIADAIIAAGWKSPAEYKAALAPCFECGHS